MRFHIDEEAHLEVRIARRFEHVRLALRRFGLADVLECQRICVERCGEQAEHQSGKILLCRYQPLLEHVLEHARRRSGHARPRLRRRRRRNLQQHPPIESGRRRIALLRRNFVLAQVFVGELDQYLELDGNEVLPLDASRASGGREALHRVEFFLAAERRARVGQHLLGAFVRCLRESVVVRRNDRRRERPANAQNGRDLFVSAHWIL